MRSWPQRRWMAILLVLPLSGAASADCPVQVERIGPGMDAAVAGLREGDCLRAWRRGAQGDGLPLPDILELRRVEWEESPRGGLELAVDAGHGPRWLGIGGGSWGLELRPDPLPPELRDWQPGADVPPSSPTESGLRQDAIAFLLLAARAASSDPALADALLQQGIERQPQDALGRAALGLRLCLHRQQSWLLEQAADACAQAEAWMLAADLPLGALRARLAHAAVLRLRAQLAEAEALVESIDAGLADMGLRHSVLQAQLLHERGALLRRQERLDAANAALQEGLALIESLGAAPRLRLAFVSTAGLVARARGDLDAARERLQAAATLSASIDPDSIQLSRDLNNLALVQWDRMDLAAALETLERSLEIKRRRKAAPLDLAATLDNLALVAFPLSRLDQAARYLEESLAIYRARAPGLPLANALQLAARLAGLRGEAVQAHALFAQADALYREHAPGSVTQAWNLHFLGLQLAREGRHAEALEAAGQAVALLRQISPGGRELGYTRWGEGEHLLAAGRAAEAVPALEEALALRRRLAPDSQTLAQSLHALGRAKRALGEREGARAHFCEAVEVLERQHWRWTRSREDLLELGADAAEAYRDCAAAQLEGGDAAAAFGTIEQGRARLQLESGERAREAVLAALPESLRLRWQSLQARAPELGAAELARQRQELGEAVRAIAPHYAASLLAAPLDWPAIAAALPLDTLLLAHWFDGSGWWIVRGVRGQAAPQFLRATADGEALLQHAQRFIALTRDARSTPEALGEHGRWLFAQLVAPALAEAPAATRLLLLPDPQLGLLPFAALQDADGRYLAERFALRQSASASAAALSELRHAPLAQDFLVVADPMPPGAAALERMPASLRERSQALPALPGAAREAESIAGLFGPRVATLSGAAATEAAVRRSAGQAAWIHFAVHGVIDAEHPLDSALVLAPGSGAPEDDGWLSVRDLLLEVPLAADLVAVAACDLGAGRAHQGEGLIGLRHALRLAGVGEVLSSLWAVADDSGARLVGEFYRQLAAGAPSDVALQRAQRRLMGAAATPSAARGIAGLVERGQEPLAAHPFHWAGFVLDGSLSGRVPALPAVRSAAQPAH
jgi:CHAT domain-containing protein